MLCEKCKKREAKVYCTEIMNGIKKEKHLCEDCAAEYTSFHIVPSMANKDVTLGDLLSGLLGNYYPNMDKSKEETGIKITCDQCGMSYEEFLQAGKFGCAHCYTSFANVLDKSLKNIQLANTHTGKKPKGYQTKTDKIIQGLSKVEMLSIKLQEAIEKEEFEEAAKLRDMIKALREGDEINA